MKILQYIVFFVLLGGFWGCGEGEITKEVPKLQLPDTTTYLKDSWKKLDADFPGVVEG